MDIIRAGREFVRRLTDGHIGNEFTRLSPGNHSWLQGLATSFVEQH
jgi:hypothetical protein